MVIVPFQDLARQRAKDLSTGWGRAPGSPSPRGTGMGPSHAEGGPGKDMGKSSPPPTMHLGSEGSRHNHILAFL